MIFSRRNSRSKSDQSNRHRPATRRSARGRATLLLAAVAGAAALVGCNVGPAYQRPALDQTARYKSDDPRLPANGPALTQRRITNKWWELFYDRSLNAIEEETIRNNPDLHAAMERVIQARAASAAVAGQFLPAITVDPQYDRGRISGNRALGGGQAITSTDITVPGDLTYEIDVWGRIRNLYAAAQATARASAADFGVVLQTLQADVATDYFNIRSLDAQEVVLANNVKSYREQITLTQTQFRVGLAATTDVLQARALLEATRAQEIDVRRQRAVYEHALAILMGYPPEKVSIAVNPLDLLPPAIPPGLSGDLLRTRPDVVEAEQNVIAANADVGVAVANFYPRFQLTGTAGFEAFDVQHLFDWESRIWSIAPSASFPLFEGGQLTQALKQARARERELADTYRTTVLGAIRDVEDALTNIHLYADELDAQNAAVDASRDYVRLAELQYKQGIVNYLQVIDADRTLLTNQLTAAQLLNDRMVATVQLIKAIGGGWDPTLGPVKQPTLVPSTQPAATQSTPTTAPTPTTQPPTNRP
jgi:multidrug efflux system outer membrane protein